MNTLKRIGRVRITDDARSIEHIETFIDEIGELVVTDAGSSERPATSSYFTGTHPRFDEIEWPRPDNALPPDYEITDAGAGGCHVDRVTN